MSGPYVGRVYQRGYGVGSVFQGLVNVAIPIAKRYAGDIGKKMVKRGVRVGIGLATDKLLGRNMSQAAKRRLKSAAVDTLRDVGRTLIPRGTAGLVGRRHSRAPIRRRNSIPVRRRRTRPKKKGKKNADIFT